MVRNKTRFFLLILALCCFSSALWAKVERLRLMWYDDPATQAVVGWDQVSGSDPVLLLDNADHGTQAEGYAFSFNPDVVHDAKGMHNHFVHLRGLRPNTTYYFVIKDSEGVSMRYYFTTAPDNAGERLSIIAGGDSRNNRDARRDANLLVAKLKPHCVLFGGDYTLDDLPDQWVRWMDDWQLTIADDGRMTPIVPTRGNHEESNRTLVDVFGSPYQHAYFGTTIGGDLLRVYTLNTMLPAGAEQRDWLERDLRSNQNVRWKIAQYHHPMRPHTTKKWEKNDLVVHWAPLFERYGVDLAVECDAHVVKATWPIRPSFGSEGDGGFVRDDLAGTVYIGEGCWGAPLRIADDNKTWTRASGSFNQFHWIFIDKYKIEIRFVKTDGAATVASVDLNDRFSIPRGLSVWSPPNGDVITIPYFRQPMQPEDDMLAARAVIDQAPAPQKGPALQPAITDELADWDISPQLVADPHGEVKVKYTVVQHCDVVVRVVNLDKREVFRKEFKHQRPGEYLKSVWLDKLPRGRYLIIIKDATNRRLLRRFRLIKR
ncbi:MAG: hypothetical protein CMN32_07720 [Saprospirales bacterium]|nr:hypothetical protein [Saprospirales bacterium]